MYAIAAYIDPNLNTSSEPMQKRSILLLLLLLSPAMLPAQPVDPDMPRPRYGGYGALNLNMHSAGIDSLPGVRGCCRQIESGSGRGIVLGGLYELPISEILMLGLRASYSGHNAVLRAAEPTTVIVGNDTVSGSYDRVLTVALSSIGIEPMLGITVMRGVRIDVGARAGIELGNSYEYREEITTPDEIGTFENSRRIRNESSGSIPGASGVYVAGLLGVSGELGMNRAGTLMLVPEASYAFGVTPVASDLSWRASAVRLGAAIKYSPLPPEIPPPPPPPDPVLAAALVGHTVAEDGTESDRLHLRVEEFVSTNMRPMLNYLFFEDGSAELPVRYARLSTGEADRFRVERLYNMEMLPTYYQVLNIVGRRMREYPSASITLVGCTSGSGAEQNNLDLARRRAVAVQSYLREVWGIAESRLKIDARDLPLKPSNPAEPDGMEENRRVEIISSSWQIIEPIVTRDTLRTLTPPVVRFYPEVTAEAGLARWSVTARQGERLMKSFAGEGSLPKGLEWNVAADPREYPTTSEPIIFSLDVADAGGRRRSTPPGEITVEQITVRKKREERLADREIDRYGLILFDFDRDELNAPNRRIADFIKARISPGSIVTITGYTDRIGDAEYNRKLSEGRANATAGALGIPAERATGVGETTPLYDNELPEGRFYSRTVNVIVETAVK